jgi:hypothetical protein
VAVPAERQQAAERQRDRQRVEVRAQRGADQRRRGHEHPGDGDAGAAATGQPRGELLRDDQADPHQHGEAHGVRRVVEPGHARQPERDRRQRRILEAEVHVGQLARVQQVGVDAVDVEVVDRDVREWADGRRERVHDGKRDAGERELRTLAAAHVRARMGIAKRPSSAIITSPKNQGMYR